VPDSATEPDRFADAVARLAGANGRPVVYPGHEDAVEAIVHAAERLSRVAILPFPTGEPLEALRDKRRLGELAERAGFAAPAVMAVGSAGDLDAFDLHAPSVVKAARSSLRLPAAGFARDRRELEALLRRFPPDETVIVQERLGNSVTALALVVDRGGRLVARFQYQSLATWPRAGGMISSGVSVAPDEALVARLASMLAELGYFGLVQFDLLPARGGVALIDANPRFYASQPLAFAAGLNLSAAWHAVARGDEPGAPRPYREGVRFRWLEADVKDAVRGHPRSLLAVQRPRPVGPMWDRADPVPGPLLAAGAVAAAARNRVRRLTS